MSLNPEIAIIVVVFPLEVGGTAAVVHARSKTLSCEAQAKGAWGLTGIREQGKGIWGYPGKLREPHRALMKLPEWGDTGSPTSWRLNRAFRGWRRAKPGKPWEHLSARETEAGGRTDAAVVVVS